MFKQLEGYSEAELLEIFRSFHKIGDFFTTFKLSDNGINTKKLHELCDSIGFDLTSYKKKKIAFCENCGKQLSGFQKKFCCSSCSASFNNKKKGKRSEETKEKIRESVKRWYQKNGKKKVLGDVSEQVHKKERNINQEPKISKRVLHPCENCGKETKNKKFCCPTCASDYRHKDLYRHFLENPEKYCNGGYSPCTFKNEVLNEQNGVCAICGCEPFHNGKELHFVMDHIDGDASNNRRSNLRLVCPNCDSQLDTFKSKNKNSKRRNYWKDKILNKVKLEPGE